MANIEWFDDLTVGMRFKSGEVQITESDIKRFAAEFDPQPMHLRAGPANLNGAISGVSA
jgi:acyl dehydratase